MDFVLLEHLELQIVEHCVTACINKYIRKSSLFLPENDFPIFPSFCKNIIPIKNYQFQDKNGIILFASYIGIEFIRIEFD